MNIKRYEVRGGRSGLEEAGGPAKTDRQVVLLSDHIASHAYDEAKERDLFEACNPKPRGVEWSIKSSRYIGSSDHFAISVYQSGWDGWKACAKSRARSAE